MIKTDLEATATAVLTNNETLLNEAMWEMGIVERPEQSFCWRWISQETRDGLKEGNPTSSFGLKKIRRISGWGAAVVLALLIVIALAIVMIDNFVVKIDPGFNFWVLAWIGLFVGVFVSAGVSMSIDDFLHSFTIDHWPIRWKKDAIHRHSKQIVDEQEDFLFGQKGKFTTVEQKFEEHSQEVDSLVAEFEASCLVANQAQSSRLNDLEQGLHAAIELADTVKAERERLNQNKMQFKAVLHSTKQYLAVMKTDEDLPHLFSRLEKLRKGSAKLITESDHEFYLAAGHMVDHLSKLKGLVQYSEAYLSSLSNALDVDSLLSTEGHEKLLVAQAAGELFSADTSSMLSQAEST